MSHYNNKYKKGYMANLAKQKKLNKPSSNMASHQLYAGQCYSSHSLSSSLGPRSYQPPQAGDGRVYIRENGIVVDDQPIFGSTLNQQDVGGASESDDESTHSFSTDNGQDNFLESSYLKMKYEKEIEELKKEHNEQIKQYQNKIDNERKENRENIIHERTQSHVMKTPKELYKDKLKKYYLIQKELTELENILGLVPIELKIFDSIEINNDLDLELDILKIQTNVINEETDKLLLIMESYLN